MKKVWLSAGMLLTACAVTLVGAACARAEQKTYSVIFMSEDAVFERYDKAQFGDAVVFPATDPVHSPDDDYQYEFLGWKEAGDEDANIIEEDTATVTGDMTYEAVYEATPVEEIPEIDRLFTVNFYDMDLEGEASRGALIKRYQGVKYGASVDAPEPPKHDGYHFVEWDIKSYDNVRGNMYITARYAKNVYTVAKHALGEVNASSYEYGAALDWSVPDAADILEFKGWYLDKEYTLPLDTETLTDMPALEALDIEQYDIDGEGQLHVYAKHEFDFSDLSIYAENGMVYGGPKNEVHLSGIHQLEELVYTYQWEVDGQVVEEETGKDLTLVNAGERAVKLTVTANYKAGFIIQKEVLEGTYTVEKATLTARPSLDRTAVTYGDPLPQVTVRYEGFLLGDTAESIGLTETHTYFAGDKDVTEKKDALDVGQYTVKTFPAALRNYLVTVGDLKFEVQKKAVTSTLTVADFIYGEREKFLPELKFEGLVYGQQPEVLGTPVFLLDGETVVSKGDLIQAGEHGLTVQALTPDNYDVTMPASAPFNVAKRSASATLSAHSGVYGTLPSPSYELSNVLEADKAHFEGPAYSYQTAGGNAYTNTEKFIVGSYSVTATFAADPNYEALTVIPASFKIEKRDITIGVSVESEYVYGVTPSAKVDFSNTDFAYGEDEKALRGTGSLVYLQGGSAYHYTTYPVGSYMVEASGYSSDNYHITFSQHDFKVTPAPLTLTLKQDDVTYGEKLTTTIEYQGFVNRENENTPDIFVEKPAIGYKQGEEEATQFHVGTYTATATASAKNYEIKVVEKAFNVTKRSASVTLTATGATYGSEPKYSYTTTDILEGDKTGFGFVYALTYTANGGDKSEFTKSGTYLPAGDYTVTVTYTENADYVLTVSAADFRIAKKALTVSVSIAGFTYGEAPDHVVNYKGFVNGENEEVLDGGLTYTYQKNGAEGAYEKNENGYFDAGSYTFTATGLTAANYALTINGGSFTVAQKALKVTADIADFTYGDTIAENVVYGEFAEGESANMLGGELVYTYKKDGKDYDKKALFDAGNYNVALSGLQSDNYAIEFVPDTFTVLKKSGVKITPFVDEKSEGNYTYGATPELTYQAEGIVNGDEDSFAIQLKVTKGGAAYTQEHFVVGDYTVTATFTPNENYEEPTLTSATFSITPKDLQVDIKYAASYVYGQTIAPTLTVHKENFVFEDGSQDLLKDQSVTYTYTKGGATFTEKFPVGAYTVTAAGYTLANYNINYNITYGDNGASFEVTPKPITATVSQADITYGGEVAPQVSFGDNAFAYGESEKDLGTRTIAYTKDGEPYTAKTYFDAGTYTVSVSGYQNANYDIRYETEDHVSAEAASDTFQVKLYEYQIDWKQQGGRNVASFELKLDGLFIDQAEEFALHGTLQFNNTTKEAGEYKYSEHSKQFTWKEGRKLSITHDMDDVTTNFDVSYEGIILTLLESNFTFTVPQNVNKPYDAQGVTIDEIQNVKADGEDADKFTPVVKYSLTNDGTDWSDILPEASNFVDVGVYTVYFQISAPEDWADYYVPEVRSFTIERTRAPLTVTYGAESKTYDNKAGWKGVTLSETPEADNFNVAYSYVDDGTDLAQIVNAGTYEVSFTITATRDGKDVLSNYAITGGNYENGKITGEFTITVDKATVTVTWEDLIDSNPTYNGTTYVESELFSIDDNNLGGYTIQRSFTGDIHDAGEYTFTVKLNNTTNFILVGAASKTFTIAKATVNKPQPDNTVFTYTGTEQTYTLNGFNEETMEYSNAAMLTQTNAGDYKFTVSLKDTKNYEWTEGGQEAVSFTFTIAKATLSVTTENQEKTYGEDKSWQGVKLGGALEGKGDLKLGGDQFVVGYEFSENTSHGDAGTDLSNIIKAGTYKVAFTITASRDKEEVLSNYAITVNGVEYTETNNITGSFIITVNQAQGEITGMDAVTKSFTYNGNTQEINLSDVTRTGDGELTFSVDDTHSSTLTRVGDSQIFCFTNVNDANRAVITAELSGTRNYKGTTQTLEITVDQAEVLLELDSFNATALTYGKTYTIPTVSAHLANNEEFQLTVTSGVKYTPFNGDEAEFEETTFINAGTYSITFSVKETENYKGASSDPITITINKASLSLNKTISQETYKGEAFTDLDEFFTVDNPVAGEEGYTYKITKGETEIEEIKDAGSYTITLNAGDNYQFVGTSQVSFTIRIDPKELEVVAEDITTTYNGDNQFKGITVNDICDSDKEAQENKQSIYKITYSFDSVVNANTYSIVAEIELNSSNYKITKYDQMSGSKYGYSYTITVEKATLTVTAPGATQTKTYGVEKTWDGVTLSETPEADTFSLTYSYTESEHGYNGNNLSDLAEIVNAGTYEVTFTINATRDEKDVLSNYDFGKGWTYNAEAETLTGTFKIIIAKATVNKPTGDTRSFTYTGTEQTYTLDGFKEETMKYSDETMLTQTNAGEYKFTVSLKDTNNYEWEGTQEDPTFTFTIAKATVTKPQPDKNAGGFVYTGKEQTYMPVDEDEANKTLYTVENNKRTNAGEQQVTVSLNDETNYKWKVEKDEANVATESAPLSFTFKINKATAQINVEGLAQNLASQGLTKDEKAENTYSATYKGSAYTVDWTKAQPADTFNGALTSVQVSVDGPIKDAKTYTVTLSIDGTANYNAAEDVVYIITINPKQLMFSDLTEEGKKSYTYKGSVFEDSDFFTVTGGQNGELGYTATISSEQHNYEIVEGADSYSITVTAANGNYYFEGVESLTVQFTINKAKAEPEKNQIDETIPMYLGITLNDIDISSYLPGYRWDWDNISEGTIKAGLNQFKAIYNPDPLNYDDSASFDFSFTTRKEKISVYYTGTTFEAEFGQLGNVEWVLGEDRTLIFQGENWRDFGEDEIEFIKPLIEMGTGLAEQVSFDHGGTYFVHFGLTLKENDYYDLDPAVFSALLKYKSVEYDGKLYTIEDALAEAQSGKTIYVKNYSAFATEDVAKMAGYTAVDGNYTIKEGVTLLLPYDGNETYYNADGLGDGGSLSFGKTSSDVRVVDLYIPDKIVLTNNGTINLGGQTTGAQKISGSTAGKYASITLGDYAKIESNGDINSYGFIIEESEDNGAELIMHKGQLKMPFIVVEHRGGTILFGAYANLQGSPFNQFYLHNITAQLTIEPSATLAGTANLNAGGMNTTKNINLVGKDNTYLLQLTDNSKLVAKVDAKAFTSANANSTVHLDLIGNVTLNSLSLSMEMLGVSANLTTKGVYLPLSWYWDVTLKPNGNVPATVTTTSQDIKLLPGGSLTVEKNVTLKAGKIAVYTDAGFNDVSQASNAYPKGHGDGALIVNGTLEAQVVGGLVQTTEAGANLNVTLANRMNTYEMKSTTGDKTSAYGDWQTLSHVLQLKLYQSGIVTKDSSEQFSGKYISKGSGESFGWECLESGQSGKVRLNIVAEGESTITVDSTPYKSKCVSLYFNPNASITYSISGATTDGSGSLGATKAGGNWCILGTENVLGALSTSATKKCPTVNNTTLTLPASGEVTIYARSWKGNDGASCIVEGTLVMLADGTQKKVEDLEYGDVLLSFNHETGQYEASPLFFNAHENLSEALYRVINLHFSDGTQIGIVAEHAFFDMNLRRYVYISEDTVSGYIGHQFAKVVQTREGYAAGLITLTGYEIIEKYTRIFSPASFLINVVTEGLLSFTEANSQGFVNIFDYDENMKEDEAKKQADIEEYGLYSYEDFEPYMSEAIFEAGQWKYFKIAVGKGQLTWDDIVILIDYICEELGINSFYDVM